MKLRFIAIELLNEVSVRRMSDHFSSVPSKIEAYDECCVSAFILR